MGAMNSFSSMMQTMNPFSSNLSLNISSSRSKYTSEGTYSVGSNIVVGGNVVLNGDSLHVRGSNLLVDGNLEYNILGDILIEARKDTFKENGKSSGFNIGLTTSTLDASGMVNPFANPNGSLNIGFNQNENWGKGHDYNNSIISVEGNTHYNVSSHLAKRMSKI